MSTDAPAAAAPPPSPPPVEPVAPPVLELLGVTVRTTADEYDEGLAGATLTLRPGELCLVRLEADAPRVPLADAACGVIDPDGGTVRFGGTDWGRMGHRRSARDRGRVGRTFAGAGWVNNLDVDENVLLAQRHHTRRPDADLRAEAAALAAAFGLPNGLPAGRPSRAGRADLARAALVRAFMGRPALLLLERPEVGLPLDAMAALTAAVESARGRGAAV
ncbi:MAG: ABC-type transport system involved in resitance to organic solvent, ATP-binding protein, partial [Phycisphaerales bacterium]|nr:ABC-type transport system involved in resitance to organic solvent, ATP-binding protein [Phycisphaerales bacterium]